MPKRRTTRGPAPGDVPGPIVPRSPLYRFVEMVAARMVERRTDRVPKPDRHGGHPRSPTGSDTPAAAAGGVDEAGGYGG
jgi:hypothetical protein